MASTIGELAKLRPINLEDFHTAVAIYQANSSDEKISAACMDYFARHLLISYTKERGLNHRIMIDLKDGRVWDLGSYEPAIKAIKELGVDLTEAFKKYVANNPETNKLKDKSRESSIKTILGNLAPI